jgi:hypothetical protein
VWVSAYIGLAEAEAAARTDRDRLMRSAARLYQDSVRSDLPEFLAWALVYQAEAGDRAKIPLACTAAAGLTSPRLQARVRALRDGAAMS